MTFDKLRVSIFEAYQNDEISRDTCENMLESVLDMEGKHIVADANAARNEFMSVALEAAGGDVEFAAFEKKATTFGQKIANVWEAFKKWVKKIIDAIKAKLGFKKSYKVRISEGFDKALDQIIHAGNAIAANAGPKEIVAALGGIALTGIGIFKGVKMITKNTKDVEKKAQKATESSNKIIQLFDRIRGKGKTETPNATPANGEKKPDAKTDGGDSTNIVISKTREFLDFINKGITALRNKFFKNGQWVEIGGPTIEGDLPGEANTVANPRGHHPGTTTEDDYEDNPQVGVDEHTEIDLDGDFDFESMLADLDI